MMRSLRSRIAVRTTGSGSGRSGAPAARAGPRCPPPELRQPAGRACAAVAVAVSTPVARSPRSAGRRPARRAEARGDLGEGNAPVTAGRGGRPPPPRRPDGDLEDPVAGEFDRPDAGQGGDEGGSPPSPARPEAVVDRREHAERRQGEDEASPSADRRGREYRRWRRRRSRRRACRSGGRRSLERGADAHFG